MVRRMVVPGITLGALLCGVSLSACGSASAAPQPPCVPKFIYSKITNLGPGFDVIDEEVHTNAGSQPETFTFYSQHGQKVSIEESTMNGFNVDAQIDASGLEVDPESTTPLATEAAQAVFDSVHETVNSVQTEYTVNVGSQVSSTIPPGATGYALYGIIVDVARGTLKQEGCVPMSVDGKHTVLLPVSYYSCSWSRGPDEFADGGQVPSQCGKVIAYDSSQ
jgi:hypothetical protein